MGMFSFLKKDEDEQRDLAAETAAPVPSTPPADAAPPYLDPASAEEGLNIDAFKAPVPESGDAPKVGAVDRARTAELQPAIVESLKTVYDPEIPVDIYELGLIYDIAVDSDSRVLVQMTLTSPACPSAQQIPQEVRYKIKALPGVSDARVDIVWEPPWTKDRMSEMAKLTLGIF